MYYPVHFAWFLAGVLVKRPKYFDLSLLRLSWETVLWFVKSIVNVTLSIMSAWMTVVFLDWIQEYKTSLYHLSLSQIITKVANSNYFIQLFVYWVEKHFLVFCISAGENRPARSPETWLWYQSRCMEFRNNTGNLVKIPHYIPIMKERSVYYFTHVCVHP